MSIPQIPQELLSEIFARLPAKSVGRCRCLSKSWRILLSTLQFAKLHLTRKPYKENLILIPDSYNFVAVAIILPIEDDVVSRKLESPNDWCRVEGSCDGLVLLSNPKDEIFLLNPTTMQQMKVPNSPLAMDKSRIVKTRGFGYDSSSDDYKIVVISYYNDNRDKDTFIDVYSKKSNAWKRLGIFPYSHLVPCLTSGVLVNGAIHWWASVGGSGDLCTIVAFDLADEVFHQISAPNIDKPNFLFNRLFVLDGFLCMVDMEKDLRIDIWMMKVYRSPKSWVKFSVNSDRFRCEILNPLCGNMDKEVALVLGSDCLIVCNLKDGTMMKKIIFDDEDSTCFYGSGTFVDSLVSPSLST